MDARRRRQGVISQRNPFAKERIRLRNQERAPAKPCGEQTARCGAAPGLEEAHPQ